MAFARFLRENAPFLAAGVLLTFMSSFGQTFFISVFAGEIRSEFGLSHGAWGGIYSAGTFASAVAMVWAGVLTDRLRVRVIGVITLITLSAACLFMALLPSVWLLPLAIFLLRFSGQGMSSHIAIVAMARWFKATRGRALSVAVMGVSAGEAILPMIFVSLLSGAGWRMLWVLASVITICVVPLLLPLLRLERTPAEAARLTESFGMDSLHWSRREMIGGRLFWLLVPSLLAPAAFSTAFFFQQVHFAEIKSFSHAGLVTLFPLFSGAAVIAMLSAGWLIDRFGTARLMPVFQLPMALGFLLMSQADTLTSVGIAMVLMGASQGMNSTVPAAFWAEFYGTRHLGAIKSLATAIMVLGTAIGPVLTGALIDAGVPFTSQMPAISGYFLLCALLVALGISSVRRRLPRPPEVDVVGP